ncbi:MAG: acyltransferase domain-containing protein [Ahniella sp.]|nr:acyltransferase domain-containing protein [Ahniella sp.]
MSREPIAIVGVSALFPGSKDATGFWRDILAGRDLLTDVPASHWLIDDYFDADPQAPDKTYARRGGFLPPVDFDALGFGIPPSTMPATDTSQLLALIVAQQVLEDVARTRIEQIDRSRISVILGVTSAQELLFSMVSRLQKPVWVKALRETGLGEDEVQAACARIAANYTPWQEASFPGLLGNVVAGRIANRLNLGGTNCVTDAACASSFSALAMAVNELHLGDSDLVITGGVDTLNDIFMYMCFSKTPALSPSGDCRPFSDRADGTMLGEGLGMVALKRLSDAERDGDRIYAVLRGVGTSSDGRAKSVYAPVSEGQAKALARAYQQAGYGAETVELVEAHGTGTKAGDAAEFEGLRQVFDASGRADRQWCALGSVKSQIGHTKAAAGAAGLFKVVMALHHKVLPPTIKVDAPNPKLALERSPFHLNTRARPWIRDARHPRRASVSAFGFGGSNFHLTLEEYTGAHAAERLPMQSHELIAVSANGAEALCQQLETLASGGKLADVAAASRDTFSSADSFRAALIVAIDSDWSERCRTLATQIRQNPNTPRSSNDGSHYGFGPAAGQTAFLFPGQGSQYLGMGGELAMQFDTARRVLDDLSNLVLANDLTLSEVMYPRPVFSADDEATLAARLTSTEWAQPALAASSLATLAVLRDLGIEADACAGHSFGELVALFAAGVYNESTLLRLSRARGEAMATAAANTTGAMLAVSASRDDLQRRLTEAGIDVAVANHNAPNQVVLSGALESIERAERLLTDAKITARRLPVATAFHSPLVASACQTFATTLANQPFESPKRALYANLDARRSTGNAQTLREQLAAQIAAPVRFVEMIETMYADGVRTFVEVGAGSVLSGLVPAILGDRPHQMIHTDRRNRSGLETLLQAIARLATLGVPVTLGRLFADVRRDAPGIRAGKMPLTISGANHGKPYPPADPASLPAPNPARVPHVAPMSESAPIPAAAIPAVATSAIEPAPMSPPVSPANAVSPEWLRVFMETQQQTAQAHTAFQQAMAESHHAFLRVAETTLAGMNAMIGTPVMPGVLPAAPAMPTPQAFVLPQAPIAAPVLAPVLTPIATAAAAPKPAAPWPLLRRCPLLPRRSLPRICSRC